MPSHSLQPVRRSDIKIGMPLPYAVYDAHGRLLLKAGERIDTERQLQTLYDLGLFFNTQDVVGKRELLVEPGLADITSSSLAIQPSASSPVSERPFHDLRLTPGKTLYIDFLGATNRPRVALRLVGYLEGEAVLISLINADGAVVPFREGELLFVRVLTGSGVATFEAKAQKVVFVPFPYLVTNFPDKVLFHVLRQHARVDTKIIASALNLSVASALPAAGVVRNLSASGAQFEGKQHLAEVGDELRIGFKLIAAGEEHVLSLRADVRGVKTPGEPDKRRFGLQFKELTVSERLLIEHFLFNALMQD
ncbi:MAG: PilZ domain protein [Alphaproteobacteria bacterium ADurb.BinA280]|jgi:c-di-GMP-binding flagellar brake protein YcgR|nr:flagellar brake protein [Xanthomonadales bacterium]MCC6504325.1 flagellar brake protein [Aquimonas sp.]OPZ10011.1 MAG: PilZ domain protein [Alphaproteobacteria bacterium ADurb.BinA280]